MRKTTLTDIVVRNLKAPAQGQFTIWDQKSPIGVRVSQGGSKTFIVMAGSGRRQTLGRFGTLTLSDARAAARRALAERTLGLTVKPSSVTFAVAMEEFCEKHYRDKRPRTKSEARRILARHFLPAFRSTVLSDVTDTGIRRELDKLAHVPSEQLHAFRFLRTMLRWCTRPPRRYIRFSPLEGYEAPSRDHKRSRVLSDVELAKVWRACEGQFGAMVRLLILWGTRNGETARTQRVWVEEDIVTIPGAFTKNGRAHALPVLPMARAVLREQPDVGPYFFPGRDSDSHFNDGSWGKLKRELDGKCGVTDWNIRDIRRTFRSNMAKLRVPREICEILLNHVTGANKSDLDEIYDRYDYLEDKRKALSKWEKRLKVMLESRY